MKKTFTRLMAAPSAAITKMLCVVAVLLGCGSVSAQQGYDECNELFKLGVEARFDYLNEALNGDKIDAASGFKVRYFNLRIDGQITQKFTYSWRQRFNRVNSLSDFAHNTDWLHLTYRPTKNWAISAGKQVVMIGGWEYDRAPIDLYFCSEYWNNVACYQLGASVAFTTNKGNDTLTFQFCQSPYDSRETDYYAYNLYWSGSHGCYTALHSLNFSQYAPGKYDAYVVLGNQFKFGDAKLQIDLMNRGVSAKELLFENFSIMGEFSYLVAERVNIFAKATYDKVGSGYPAGLFLYPGTEMTRVGGGVEYYPLGGRGNRDIRLHAAYAYNIGNNTNPAGTALDGGSYLTVGLTWRIDMMSAAQKLINKIIDKREAKM
ncbi:MAG: porin [Alistipes sp.]|nr:porin [Alistipes sp.]